MNEKEIWKEIDGERGYYVSNMGRVKTPNYRRTGREEIMKQSENADGYGRLVVNIRGTVYAVRYLVAVAFVPNPNKYRNVLHKDGDFRNVRADNLEWYCNNFNKPSQER